MELLNRSRTLIFISVYFTQCCCLNVSEGGDLRSAPLAPLFSSSFFVQLSVFWRRRCLPWSCCIRNSIWVKSDVCTTEFRLVWFWACSSTFTVDANVLMDRGTAALGSAFSIWLQTDPWAEKPAARSWNPKAQVVPRKRSHHRVPEQNIEKRCW